MMEFFDYAFLPQLLSTYMLYLGAAMIRGRCTRAARWIDALLGVALVGVGARLALSRAD